MADLFYRQNLISDNLRCLEQSVLYAQIANDTLAMLGSYAQKMGSYDRLGIPDSVIAVSENTYRELVRLGKPQFAAQYVAPAIKNLLLYLKGYKQPGISNTIYL